MNNSATIFSTIIDLVPMILFVLVLVWYVRSRGKSKSGMTSIEIIEEMLAEQKRHNQKLEQLLDQTNKILINRAGSSQAPDKKP